VGDDDEVRAGSAKLLEAVFAAISAYPLRGDNAVHSVRVLRSALHGFIVLEKAGNFALPAKTGDTFARLVEWLVAGLNPA
jgi:hypothetical protein